MKHPSELTRQWIRLHSQGADAPPVPSTLGKEIAQVFAILGRWVQDPGATDLDALRPAFRQLSLAFRGHGFTVEENLDALGEMEELLLADSLAPGGAASPSPETESEGGSSPPQEARALRDAMRAMVKETVRVNIDLEGRRQREYGDALWSFGEILSHELGNRLGAARTGVDLLVESPDMDPSRRSEIISLVAAGIDGALTTVDDVTAYTDVQRWGAGLALPFSDVARRVAQGLQPLARRHGVWLEVREPLPTVRVEGARLRLILSNLLVNGVRYSDPEKSDSWVELAAREEEGWVEVEISDNGVGIAREEQERVFQYHQRGSASDAEPGGSGLGLAIVREAIQQLGGETLLESIPGEGATFRLRIPGLSGASEGPASPGDPEGTPAS